MKTIYCPYCDKEVGYKIALITAPITVLGTMRTMRLLQPYCLACGEILDIPAIERINTYLIDIKFGDVLKR